MSTFKFNDYPFNAMRIISPSIIEAHFNVGNPKVKDTIIRNDKEYVIEDIDYFNDIFTLYVKEARHNV